MEDRGDRPAEEQYKIDLAEARIKLALLKYLVFDRALSPTEIYPFYSLQDNNQEEEEKTHL